MSIVHIEIGGAVPECQVEELCEAIVADGLRDELTGRAILTGEQAEEAVYRAAEAGATLRLHGEAGGDGTLDALEGWLEENGIPYRLRNPGGDDGAPEVVVFDGQASRMLHGSAGGDTVVYSEEDIRQARLAHDPRAALDALLALAEFARRGPPALSVEPRPAYSMR